MQPDDREVELQSIDTLRDDMPIPTAAAPQRGLTKAGKGEGLRYRHHSAWLLAVYLPLLVIPWVLTAIMMFRPINFPSYQDPTGNVTQTHLAILERWQTAARVLKTIAFTLGLPIVSALLAHGAVVYTQRSRPGQHLNGLQLFILADRMWTSVAKLTHLPKGSSSLYLWLATGLIVITALQPFLQSILIEDETKTIVTCKGHPRWFSGAGLGDSWSSCQRDGLNGVTVGFDPDPALLADCPQLLVFQRTLAKLIDASQADTQMYMWPDIQSARGVEGQFYADGAGRNNFYDVYSGRYSNYSFQNHAGYFVSSITNNTSTGVYREHAARMDSRVRCTNVTTSSFPRTCRGNLPFEANFSHPKTKVGICVEGDSRTAPWSTSRDRQEHSERLWLHVNSTYTQLEPGFTFKCESTSRRGWFELPNLHNNYVAGPLLDVWPSTEELEREFNDYKYPYYKDDMYPEREPPIRTTPSDWGWPALPYSVFPGSDEYLPTPGPLMTAAMAMFGNASVFHAAATANEESYNETVRQICEQVQLPFSRFDLEGTRFTSLVNPCRSFGGEYGDPELQTVIGSFFGQFQDGVVIQTALEVAMFFANEALLTLTTSQKYNYNKRPILSSVGDTVTKPKKSIPGLAIISLLVLLQVVGLLWLAAFIYSAPTWTGNLDADALAQMGAQIRDFGEPRPDLRDTESGSQFVVPLPTSTGLNQPAGQLLKGATDDAGHQKTAALLVGVKLDLEAEVHLTARVKGDIVVGLY
ncbi:hypothetical protein B0T10DRAFT_611173 [Thelonectria olida]|uniref:Uncharacterized protein n=1 Tax=Thelonectria olida TaxID=1576542 RepID=A0A9P9AII8_9HYPO|nr:hypothetical protein B0T10DRAFT_611173 [Thelonectria olida]